MMKTPKSANTTFSSTDSTGVSVSALPSVVAGGGAISEHAIAGLLLADPDRTFRLCAEAKITPAHFIDPTARKVYRTVAKLHSDGHPLDSFAVVAGCGVDQSACEKLVDAAPIPEHAESYVSELVLAHGRRTLANTLCKAVDALNEPASTPEFVLSELLRSVDQVESKAVAQIIDAALYVQTDPPQQDPIIDGLFESGDKVGIIASAKRKKSWFALQLAISVATGKRFISWDVPKARRVLIVQPEIKPEHYHRRVHYMTRAMGVDHEALAGRLGIVNARGQAIDPDAIRRLAQSWKAELVIVDPLYKLAEGDENKAQDIKPLLAAFDSIAVNTGAAVLWVHHDSKGSPGDRDARDRGAGSNVLIRDVDQLFTLTPHRDDPDATVVETLARNYADELPTTIAWDDGCFNESSLTAIPKTSANVSKYADALRKLDADQPGLSCSEAAEIIGCDRSRISRLRKQRGVA